MDSSKVKKIIDIIVKILVFISGFFNGKNKGNESSIEIEQDYGTNVNTLNRVNEEIAKRIGKNAKRISLSIVLMLSLCGCFTINLGGNEPSKEDEKKVESVILANPLNVYRTSTNTILKAMVQNKKGTWENSKKDVLIPSGWYIVSGIGIDGEN